MRIWSCVRAVLMMVVLVPFAYAAPTPTEARAIAVAEQDHTAYTLHGAALAKAEALYPVRVATYLGGTAWGIVSVWLLLRLGAVAWMRDRAVRASKNRWTQGPVFVLEFLLATTLMGLPVAVFAHSIQLKYGLSVQGWGSWLADEGKSFVLNYGLSCLLVMMVFLLIRRFAKTWWLWAAVAAMAFELAGVFLTPYVVDPLFNRFEPLAQSNPALVEQLERIVAKGDGIVIPPERMFLMRASDKVTTLNAYVTGFGASKRVVVWDTSIQKGTTDEILFIFGHEMGHYVLGHIVRGLLLGFAGTLVAFFVGFQMLQWMLRNFGARWGLAGQEDWGAVAVMVLVLSVLTFFAEPISNSLSRDMEHQADVYGQEVVHGIVANPQATGQASFQLLGENSYAYPNPSATYQFWTGSHPANWFRAAFAKVYDPWAAGEAPKYVKK
jgi:STE24 endopeptidase